MLSAALAREIAEAEIAVFAVTSPATVAAGLAARELGAPRLALAGGFTALDASPVPSLTLGEQGLFAEGPAARDWALDTFALLRRGLVGVAVAPAQLDSAARSNLSGIGPPGRPKVALPGARGLPDNNITRSRVWFLLPAHSSRQLVDRVDVVCGAQPPAQAIRRLLTPAGCFEHAPDGWRAVWLAPGGAELVEQTPGLGVRLTGSAPVLEAPDREALAAVRRADPHDVRAIEFASSAEAPALWSAAAAREAER